MRFEQSHFMSMHSYTLKVWRVLVVITNRPQLFEERELPSVNGWWVNVRWCRA